MTEKPPNITDITKISMTPIMTQIVDFLKATGEEFNAKTLALRLNLNPNTTRTYLNKLAKAKIVTRQKFGRASFYTIPTVAPEIKHELPELKFHGLTLKFKHHGKQWCGYPGWWREAIYLLSPETGEISSNPHQVSTTRQARKLGVVKFQQGQKNLMVYYDASKRPLNWKEFLGLLRWVGKVTRSDPLQDPRWEIRQWGVGNDFEKRVLEGFKGSVSIHDMVGHVARIYNKEIASGEEVVRVELHGERDMVVAGFLESLQGGMLSGQILNLVGRQTVSQEQGTVLQRIIIKKLDRVAGLLVQLLQRRNQK